eukprot:TRINITY_DN15588_c0_g2_i3.p1 TRINITY_DN15588_c0_g2~~TRINITY_DN15588_c0_g2_i3.p1  ORF type:complete len:296 (-),score=38.04 TRINITY_DN15588_c0_g2_i3:64-951(-)
MAIADDMAGSPPLVDTTELADGASRCVKGGSAVAEVLEPDYESERATTTTCESSIQGDSDRGTPTQVSPRGEARSSWPDDGLYDGSSLHMGSIPPPPGLAADPVLGDSSCLTGAYGGPMEDHANSSGSQLRTGLQSKAAPFLSVVPFLAANAANTTEHVWDNMWRLATDNWSPEDHQAYVDQNQPYYQPCGDMSTTGLYMSEHWMSGGGHETDTTIMLRNLPNDYTRDMLTELLDELGFSAQYDFVYLPVDFKRWAGLGYAFINMVSNEAAREVIYKMTGFQSWKRNSGKVCEAI